MAAQSESAGVNDADQEMLSLIVAGLPKTAVIVLDRRLKILFASGGGLRSIFGRAAELVGRPLRDVLDPAAYLRAEPVCEATLAGEDSTFEFELPGGDRTYWIRTTPMRTATGDVYAGLGVVTDITDQRIDELRRARYDEQLERSRRLEAVGKLAGGVAHDFNNTLAVVLNYADFVADALPDDSPLRQDLHEIKQAAERGAALTRQLLIFSRREVTHPERIDLNVIIGELERLLLRTLGEDVSLRITAADGLWSIEADPGEIEQALVGMAINAREAMPDGGSLAIETENVMLDAEYVLAHAESSEGPHVRVTVSDTGRGIDPAHQERIFDPFFTTKARGQTSGLGLAAVHGMVGHAGGHIAVYSEKGVGTVFRLHFPVAPEQVTLGEFTDEAPEAVGSRILVAEDDAAMRKMAARVLTRAGHEVTVAEDGLAGIELLESGERYDLVLADVIMPRASGRDLADRASELAPDTPVLFMSGYTDEIISSKEVLVGDVALIRKPFTANELLAGVARGLNAPR